VKRMLMKSGLIAALALNPALLAQSPNAAVVNGETISEDQVAKAAASDLARIEQRRAQLELALDREKKVAMETALNEIVEERVLAAESKKRGVAVDALVQMEVEAKLSTPTDQAVERFYEENKSRINATLDQVRNEIRNYLRDRERDRLFANFVDRLKKEYGVRVYLEPARTAVAVEGHPAKGPANAPVTIVEFSDFECPFCAGFLPTLREIEKNYKDKVRIVYRQFPLTNIHPNAAKAAEASLCAHEQNKFWPLHDAMFADQSNLGVEALKKKAAQLSLDMTRFDSCLDLGKYARAVEIDVAEGAKAGVNGTPSIFINGRFFSGNLPYEEVKRVVDDELARAAAKQ